MFEDLTCSCEVNPKLIGGFHIGSDSLPRCNSCGGVRRPPPEKINIDRPKNYVRVVIFPVRGSGADTEIFLGKRRVPSYVGYYASPGGSVEVGEQVADAAARELHEETNIKTNPIGLTYFDHKMVQIEGLGPVLMFYYCVNIGWDIIPDNTEPDKCEGWEWYNLKDLPEKILPNAKEMLRKLSVKNILRKC